jgi:Sulfotransferase family
VCALYDQRREEIEGRGWNLLDVYRELGGGSARGSELHGEFRDFFNGQTRALLAAGRQEARLEYWAGIPERGAALRSEALETLARHRVQVERGEHRSPPDPRTRSLILAHNQIDAELHAHFSGVVERDRPRRRSTGRQQRRGASAAVCVLGAPRSGTSLTARILNILGVELGFEEELMEPAADNNPAGFWEHEGIADLNEDILASLGDAPRQRWRRPPPLEEGWERDPRLEPHRAAAETILRRSFGGRPLWGWKDPRTSLTLPFWRQLVPDMRYVICVRHPLDVAASLEARDRMPLGESLRLWRRYMSDALAHTAGRPRLVVAYESYFAGWERQAERLATFLGVPAPGEEQREAIVAHLDTSMWHHRGARQRADVPAECEELYALLSELAQT